MKKKLKSSKHRIILLDGEELQYHVPPKPERSLKLEDFVPPDFRKIEVEIGCGKGELIARLAQQTPDTFFIGIDRRSDRLRLTLNKLQATPHGNYKILKEDARSFLTKDLPQIDKLHIYHPDPWPKERQHKHRFFRSPDAKIWAEAIKPGGVLSLSTDHFEYFQEILKIVESWRILNFDFAWKKTSGEPMTYFEGIFLKKNQPVYKAHFTKKK